MAQYRKVGLYVLFVFVNIAVTWGHSAEKKRVYEGYVVSATDETKLADVICQVFDAGQEAINYTISDKNGFFQIELHNHAESIQFRLLGYATLTIPITNIEAKQTVKLHESIVSLNEVVVSVPPIQSDNDTLKYNVSSFKGQEDRYVSDVLKKLPGIAVAENGTISYMGESINKFYIEGRDLLGGQYSIATNNLNIDAISAIEVLQNNQHIKALKGLTFAEKSAINIKLKKGYKVRPFGEVQMGAGGIPLMYDGKALATYLGEKVQALVNVKGQNNGEYILDELDDKLDVNDLFSFEPLLHTAVTLPSPRGIQLPTSRHLFNKTFLSSANGLVPVSENSEFKVNVSYGADYADQTYSLLQNLAIGNDFLRIEEQTKQKNKIDNARVSIAYEHNSTDKYIKNEVIYYHKRKKVESHMDINGNIDASILGTNNTDYIQNHFHSLFKLKNNRTINVNSFVRFEKDEDDLKKNREEINELFKTQYIVNKNRVSSSFDLFKHKLNLGFDVSYKQKDISNHLLLQTTGVEFDMAPFQGMQIRHTQIGFDPNYQIRTRNRNLYFTLMLPVYYSKYAVKSGSPKDERVIFTPSISNTWQIDHQWETFIRVGYGFNYANDRSVLSTPYFSSYRLIYVPSNSFNTDKNLYVTSRLRYKDIVNMLFVNLNFIYRFTEHNYINTFYNTSEWSYYSTQNQENKGQMLSIMSNLSKTFTPYRLSISISPSYTKMTSNIIQQNIPVKNVSNVASLATNIELKAIKNVSLVYKATGKTIWNENNLTKTTPLKEFTQNASLYYFPTKNIDLAVMSDYIIYEREKDKYSNFFFLDFKGTHRYKRIEYGFLLKNLLNNNLFSLTELSSVNRYNQQLPLRRREFLLFFKFNY